MNFAGSWSADYEEKTAFPRERLTDFVEVGTQTQPCHDRAFTAALTESISGARSGFDGLNLSVG